MTTSTASPLDKLAPAGSRPIISRHFEIDLRARGRSARPAAGFSIRCVPPLCTAGFGTARDGARAGGERTRCRRTCRRTSRTRRRVVPPSTTRGCATVRARARRRAPPLLESRIRGISSHRRADISRPPPRSSRSADVSAHALLPIRRARLVRGPMGGHFGMHGQEEEARSRSPVVPAALRSFVLPDPRLARRSL